MGDEKDIHRSNKRPVGERLARYALGQVYGQDILFTGPSVDSVAFRGGRAIISLKDAEGLYQKGEHLGGFTIAGEDARFVPATAELDGGQLIVHSAEVNDPVAVRYLWSNWIDPAQVRLFNAAGLPLAPFRTDDFKVVTQR